MSWPIYQTVDRFSFRSERFNKIYGEDEIMPEPGPRPKTGPRPKPEPRPEPGKRPEFTTEEAEEFKRIKKVCDDYSKPKRGRTLTDCTLLKDRETLRFDLFLANLEIGELKQESRWNWLRDQGRDMVSIKMNNIVTEAMLLSNALKHASDEYDNILKTRASKPIAGEIVLGLALSVLPHLKVVDRAVGAFCNSAYLNGRLVKMAVGGARTPISGSWEQFYEGIAKFVNNEKEGILARLKPWADPADGISKDAIEAVLNPMVAKADVDKATQERMAAFMPKNQIVKDIVKDIETKIVLTRTWLPALLATISSYEGGSLLIDLTEQFKTIGFNKDIKYDPKEFNLFSQFILYDMLRAYAKANCKVVNITVPGLNSHVALDYDKDTPYTDFIGLDAAQRKLIVDKFNSSVWEGKPKYPPINSSIELVEAFKIDVKTKVVHRVVRPL